MPLYSYQIAAAWNNTAGFTNVESIAVAGATLSLTDLMAGAGLDASTHVLVSAEPTQHNRRRVGTGVSVQHGYIRQMWRMLLMSGDALNVWRATYVGQVTVATKSDDIFDTYTNWNAIADYPVIDGERFHRAGQWWYPDVKVPLLLVGAPS